jgi:hypothetical protein
MSDTYSGNIYVPAYLDILRDLESRPRQINVEGLREAFAARGLSRESVDSRMKTYEFINSGVWPDGSEAETF